MQKVKILIAGGYGSVGSFISSLLSQNSEFIPVIAGISEEKAKALAEKLNCRWQEIDLENENYNKRNYGRKISGKNCANECPGRIIDSYCTGDCL